MRPRSNGYAGQVRWAEVATEKVMGVESDKKRSMKQHPLSLMGVTRTERHKAIAGVGDAIATAGGWIVDHAMFSNAAIAIRFVMPSERLEELLHAIAAAGVWLDDVSLAGVRQAAGGSGNEGDEIRVSVNITFIHDEPDLLQVVPPIPG